MKSKQHYTVYSINHLGTPIYIGITNDLSRRTKQHNYLYRKGFNKQVYNYIRSLGYKDEPIIYLTPMRSFNSRTRAKQFEMYLILQDLFGDKNLEQRVPNISDR